MTHKKILVLGATGHLGAYSSVYLNECGYDVVAIGHRNSDNGFFLTKGIEYIGGFDLSDKETFKKLPTDIDAVVHLAGTMPAHADASPMPYINSIVVGMVNLCEWLKITKWRRVIFNTTPSDVCQFFGTDKPVKDDAQRSFPKDGGDHAIYAIAKNAAVDILEHYNHLCGISSCIFRHLTVYGYQPNPYYHINGVKKMLPWRIIQHKAEQNQPVEIWGDPSRKKELLYIKDFTNAVKCALETGVEGIFNLSGDRPYTLEEQIDGIIETFNSPKCKSEKIYIPDKPNTPQNLLDSTKAKEIMSWIPKYDWKSACIDMKKEKQIEPFSLLWGKSEEFKY
ncbi:NAD(P)-dependent oxidoreductase [uncultured Muribaculum sp.]|uniref:NAD-dependent epimerase/dehydratase family protein n=1 Tax=uncultured Muribaculum sp. TaxID=1918613 RepID=UPI00265B2F23|nr:NAD(P)-dependent oxidoreductase [uncultured Muribaculum sp.]